MSNVRLEKIEWTLERHDVLIQTSIKSLASINANLQQMKWFGIGAVVVVVANQFGLSTFKN